MPGPIWGRGKHMEEGAICGRKLSHIPLSNLVVAGLCSVGASLQQGEGKWSELTGRWKELVGNCKRLETGQRFTFQQDNDPEYKARAPVEWLKTQHIPCVRTAQSRPQSRVPASKCEKLVQTQPPPPFFWCFDSDWHTF